MLFYQNDMSKVFGDILEKTFNTQLCRDRLFEIHWSRSWVNYSLSTPTHTQLLTHITFHWCSQIRFFSVWIAELTAYFHLMNLSPARPFDKLSCLVRIDFEVLNKYLENSTVRIGDSNKLNLILPSNFKVNLIFAIAPRMYYSFKSDQKKSSLFLTNHRNTKLKLHWLSWLSELRKCYFILHFQNYQNIKCRTCL